MVVTQVNDVLASVEVLEEVRSLGSFGEQDKVCWRIPCAVGGKERG